MVIYHQLHNQTKFFKVWSAILVLHILYFKNIIMKLIQLSILLWVFIISTACFSQEEEDQLISVFSNKENSMDVLSKFSAKTTSQNLPVTIQNSVYVQQIGNNNNALTKIKATVSDVDLNQNGNSNSIYLNKSASEINQFVLQEGNNNSVIDFNYKYNNTVNSTYSQAGNNLNIVNIGSNSISKDLTIKQTGNSGSVLILNK